MEKAESAILKYSSEGSILPLIVLAIVGDQISVKLVLKKEVTVPELSLPSSSTTFKGQNTIARYLARKASRSGLYGKDSGDALALTEIDQWIDFSNDLTSCNTLDVVSSTLNQHLQMRSVLAQYQLTLADIAVWAALKKNPNWYEFISSNGKTLPHLVRWWSYVECHPKIQEFNDNSSSTQIAKASVATGGRSTGSFSNLNLRDAKEGTVVTRFPPEPSGYLHIGHAKAALMNNYYATHYKGKLILRFDDTNPAKEKVEFIDSITSDLKTLGIVANQTTYTSDWFPRILQYAEQIIMDGNAYVDNTNVEQMRIERGEGIESKNRNATVEENMRLWNEMLKGTDEGVKCVLRGKINMQEKNKCLRDPALARCNIGTPHHRTGSTYKVYPLYDFACPIVDSLEGVTHALRSSEYHDRNPLYSWVCRTLRIREPCLEDFSRLNFKFTLLSKRKLQWVVDHGFVSGWDDPRFPTIQGMLRRGLTVEALTEFILSQGASKSLNLMEPGKLWAVNKKVIDPIVPRYTAIAANQGKAIFNLAGGPEQPIMKSIPRHKKNPALGNKIITYTSRVILESKDAMALKSGEEVTLMDWGNAIVDSISTDSQGNTTVNGRLHLEGNFKDTEKKLNWLADIQDLIKVTLIEFGSLITKEKIEEDDKIEDLVNKRSEEKTPSLGDPNLRSLSKGDRIQLERRGYYICDEAYFNASKPMVLILIPDGHTSRAQSTLTTK